MSEWGRATYGDPCRECGFAWTADIDAMVGVVRATPGEFRALIGGTDGTAQAAGLAWDARSYVCHVVDNLRIWAERLIAAAEQHQVPLGVYDADLLAEARNYRAVPVAGALWALDNAVQTWVAAVHAIQDADLALVHPERGPLRLTDVVSTNAHDASHHLADARRCLRAASTPS